MTSDYDHLQRADRLIWSVIGIIGGIIFVSSFCGPFHIDWISFQAIAILSLLLCIAGRFYSNWRQDRRAASALVCAAQFALFAAVAAPLSYIAASTAHPLWDETFAAWDRGLGLDWMAWLATMNNYPALHWIFAAAYSSFLLQTTIAVLFLSIAGHSLRLRLYVLSFVFATLLTIAFSAVMPAQGVWGHLQLSPENYPAITPVSRELHLTVFHGLRDGSFRHLVAQGAEGIITFPSLHTAGGFLFIFAMWPLKYLRWIATLLNVTMIAATPIDGGHYFSDVIAGTAVSIPCWMAAARIVGIRPKVGALEVRPITDPASIIPSVLADNAGGLRSPDLEPLRHDARPGAT